MTSSPLRFVLFCTVVLTALAAGAVPDAGTVLPVRVDGGVTDAGVADDAGDGFADAGVLVVDAGIEFVDAGDAMQDEPGGGTVDAGAGTVAADEEPANVVAHDAVSPLRFVRSEGRSTARARASLASRALVAALEADPEKEGGDDATIRIEGDVVVARIGGIFVASYTAADVAADGEGDLAAWAAAREPQLAAFIADQRQRDHIRHTVTQVTLSIAIALLAFLLLRTQRRVFANWQETLDQRGPLNAPIVLGVPLLSADAARALLVSGLQILRVLALGGTIFAAIVTIGGRFDRTQPWVDALIDGLVTPVVRGAQGALRGVPGVLLAGVIALVALALYRFLRILLDGVAAGRVRSTLFEREQAPVARIVVGGAFFLIAAVLIVAAFFLRFGTAIEDLVLIVAAAIGLGTVPFFANAVAGLAVQWRQPFAVGDHVRVGDAHGEVVRLRPHDVLLVPEEGGTITVPMLALLMRPVQRLSSEPRAHVDTVFARDRNSDAVLDGLKKLVLAIDESGRIEVLAASSTTLTVRLIAGRGDGAHQHLWRALLRACDAGDVRLAERLERSGAVARAGESG